MKGQNGVEFYFQSILQHNGSLIREKYSLLGLLPQFLGLNKKENLSKVMSTCCFTVGGGGGWRLQFDGSISQTRAYFIVPDGWLGV